MFGWLKKRVFAGMSDLAKTGQLVTGIALLKHYRVDEATDESDQTARAAKAAAIANYFFGKTSDPLHTQSFDLPALYEEGHQWLLQNASFRELVVQSLRVIATAEYGMSGNANIVGETILTRFGREFPSAPNPETYKALVYKAIASLPPVDQQRVLDWMRTGR